MSLDNATLSYISNKLSTVFSGQKLASLAGEYCVISTISPLYLHNTERKDNMNQKQNLFIGFLIV